MAQSAVGKGVRGQSHLQNVLQLHAPLVSLLQYRGSLCHQFRVEPCFLWDCKADDLSEERFSQDHMRFQALKVFLQVLEEREVSDSNVSHPTTKAALDVKAGGTQYRSSVSPARCPPLHAGTHSFQQRRGLQSPPLKDTYTRWAADTLPPPDRALQA